MADGAKGALLGGIDSDNVKQAVKGAVNSTEGEMNSSSQEGMKFYDAFKFVCEELAHYSFDR
jgi:hypothetical protein